MSEVISMSKIIFTEMQMNQLEANPNVVKVSERAITYHPEFKIKAAKANLEGKGPLQIFIDNGFDVEVIGREKPQQCLDRWRKTYRQYGEDGFYSERRGKGSGGGRPSSKSLSAEEKLKKAEARIAFLEAELTFLKKLEELERQASQKNKH